jgi:hypothetical protein
MAEYDPDEPARLIPAGTYSPRSEGLKQKLRELAKKKDPS